MKYPYTIITVIKLNKKYHNSYLLAFFIVRAKFMSEQLKKIVTVATKVCVRKTLKNYYEKNMTKFVGSSNFAIKQTKPRTKRLPGKEGFCVKGTKRV